MTHTPYLKSEYRPLKPPEMERRGYRLDTRRRPPYVLQRRPKIAPNIDDLPSYIIPVVYDTKYCYNGYNTRDEVDEAGDYVIEEVEEYTTTCTPEVLLYDEAEAIYVSNARSSLYSSATTFCKSHREEPPKPKEEVRKEEEVVVVEETKVLTLCLSRLFRAVCALYNYFLRYLLFV